jgi:hypothetical protein
MKAPVRLRHWGFVFSIGLFLTHLSAGECPAEFGELG